MYVLNYSNFQKSLAGEGWNHSNNQTKKEVQEVFQCCGFNSTETGFDCPQVHLAHFQDYLLEHNHIISMICCFCSFQSCTAGKCPR